MDFITYMTTYKDEQTCIEHFRLTREKQGLVCSKCQGTHCYWISSILSYQCANCRKRFSLKKDTIMENSKLKFHTWYLISGLMTYTKKGMSACEVRRAMGNRRYESLWNCMHKIRQAMGNRDALYLLEDMIELDDAQFQVSTEARVKSKLNRGRGSQQKQTVCVMAESTPLEDIETGLKSSQCRYFKMKVLPSYKPSDTDQIVTAQIAPTAAIRTDESTSYVNLSKVVEVHVAEKSSPKTTNTTLKWTHIAISNAKRTFLGVYHKIKGKYLQKYLDEFTYKLNRRYFGVRLVERVIIALAQPMVRSCG